MAERYILDPAEEVGDRVEFDITDWMTPEGAGWEPTTNAPFYADGDVGQVVIDERWNNREVPIPLHIQDRGGTAFATARSLFQAKVGEIQGGRGGVLKRVTNSGTVYADIVSARLKLGGDSLQAIRDFDVNASLDLVLGPENYGPWVGDTTESFDTPLGSNYTFDTAPGTADSSGGVLVGTSTAEKRIARTDVVWFDQQVTVKVTTTSGPAGFTAGPIVKRIDSRTYIAADLRSTGTVSIFQVVGGTFTEIASTTARVAASTSYWVRGRVEGNKATVEIFTAAPDPGSVPAAAASGNLSGSGITTLGAGIAGNPGIRFTPSGSLLTTVDDLVIQPNVFTGTGEIVATIYGIEGDFPPGNRCRMVVTDTSGNDQRGLVCAFRSRNYDPATTAALSYEAEALTPLDAARGTALAGASGGTAVTHPSLMSSWTPVCGGTAMTHVGNYRMCARVHSPGGSDISLRTVWDVGDLVFPSENRRWTFPDSDRFYIADLGEVRLQRPPTDDDYSWAWQIQGLGAAGGEAVSIDRVWLEPVDEFMARATTTLNLDAINTVLARDGFDQAAGALTGSTLPIGGRWQGAGDADDAALTGTNAVRRAVSDGTFGPHQGRLLTVSGMTADTIAASVDLSVDVGDAALSGLLSGYQDSANFVAVLLALSARGASELLIYVRSAGRYSKTTEVAAGILNAGQTYRLSTLLTDTGLLGVWLNSPSASSFGQPLAVLDTGYTHTVTAGIADYNPVATSATRTFDNFVAWTPAGDAVAYANRAAQLGTDGLYRQDATGRRSGSVSNAIGKLPRLPASGVTGNPTELFVKTSRGDLDQLPDPALDPLEAQVFYRPCWLGVPEA